MRHLERLILSIVDWEVVDEPEMAILIVYVVRSFFISALPSRNEYSQFALLLRLIIQGHLSGTLEC